MKERKTENPRRGEADGHGEASPVLLLFSGILFAFAFAAEHLFRLPAPLCAALYLLPYLLSGFGCIKEAVSGIFHGDIFGEEFLMTAASVGAFCVGSFAEGAAVMLLFSLGEFFEELAVGKTRSSVRALMAIRPETAHVRTADGSVSDAAPETVPVGAVIEVRAGERVPLDGIVLSGAADLDTAALTGESVPRPAAVGDTVCSGCICTNGVLTVRTAKTAGDSAAARILALTETETSRKTRAESFLSRFSGIYTPLVVGAAVLLAVIPPLVTGAWSVWIHRALTFLVVSCPCALVISVPLTFFCGIGAASSMGVLIKGSAALETLSRVSVVASDKTGTLTEGKLRVTSVSGKNENRLLFLTAHAEVFSAHPAARAILSAYETAVGKKPDARLASGTTETAGRGVSAVVSENGTPVRVLAGNAAWMAENGVRCDSAEGSVIHAAAKTDGAYEYLGCIRVADTLKKDAVTAVSSFRACGVREIHMLTGDTEAAAKPVSDALGLDGCHAGLFPEEKLKAAHSLRKKAASSGGCLLCVGDGINDAPFHASGVVGAAMGALGSDAAMEAADIVVMDDMPSKLPRAMRLSGKTVGIARENIIFAVSVKVLILLLGAFGYAGMWAAVFGDVGVTLLCIANAARAAIRRY